MRVKHVFEGQIYVISNFGVARNPIYRENEDVEVFKDYLDKYLGEICDIFAYSHQENCFHYLIRIKERSELEAFFYSKQAAKKKNISHKIYDVNAIIVPDSYLIFSQEVSNCLNAYAKKFNAKYKRKGGLFGDRYAKHLVESAEEMEEWIDRLNNLEVEINFSNDWKVLDRINLGDEKGRLSSKIWYKKEAGVQFQSVLSNFILYQSRQLRGSFINLRYGLDKISQISNSPPNSSPNQLNPPP